MATMMNSQLTISLLMDRGPELAPDVEVVTRFRDRIHRTNYAEVGRRARQLAGALRDLGIGQGDRVASFGWNTFRHLELYYAVPCMGAILHTLNLRLSAADLEYIINHAEDKVIFIDEDLLPLLERLAGKMPTVKQIVVMSNSGSFRTILEPALDYESILAAQPPEFVWPELDENTPMGLCYTSGTTGKPKGVQYTHRSNYLHTITGALPELMGLSRRDAVLAIVPMFHANAWGMPFTGMMLGLKQVFPGPMMDGASICQLIQDEKITFTAGVPTIWLGVMNELRQNPGKYDLSSLKSMVCGGSAPPRALIEWFESNLGVEFIQAWGMTETSPLGTVTRLKPQMADWPRERQLDIKQRAGLCAPGLEMRIVDGEGKEVPRDGSSMGRLLIRGPWIASTYYREEPTEDKFPGGWLDTGDMGYTADGYLFIVGRAKDMIIINGKNHWPQDIEWAVEQLPGFNHGDIAAFAIEMENGEEAPAVLVHCKVSDPEERVKLRDQIADKVRSVTGMSCIVELVPPRTMDQLRRM